MLAVVVASLEEVLVCWCRDEDIGDDRVVRGDWSWWLLEEREASECVVLVRERRG